MLLFVLIMAGFISAPYEMLDENVLMATAIKGVSTILLLRWSYLIYSCSQCITISPAQENNPTDYGRFSGKLFLSIESTAQTETGIDKLLMTLLASPGLGQILDRGAALKTFNRRSTTVSGKPATRLETMGEFGDVNHMLVIVNNGRATVLRGQGDGRVFDAMVANLHLP